MVNDTVWAYYFNYVEGNNPTFQTIDGNSAPYACGPLSVIRDLPPAEGWVQEDGSFKIKESGEIIPPCEFYISSDKCFAQHCYILSIASMINTLNSRMTTLQFTGYGK